MNSQADENPRQLIAGRFEIRHTFPSDGATEVHVARDFDHDLDVALWTRPIVDEDDLKRLRREAGMLMRVIAHRGLPVVRSDLVEADRYYLISDFVEGTSLRSMIESRAGSGIPLSAALPLIDDVAETLQHLHNHRPRLIHGGVTPDDLIVAEDGRVVLVALARMMSVLEPVPKSSLAGFAAPELLTRETLTPAADVYSLAALAVYLLTGIAPGVAARWPDALIEAGLVHMEQVLRRGLTWDPLGRPQSVAEFLATFREAAQLRIPAGTVTLVVVVDQAEGESRSLAKMLAAGGGRVAEGLSLPLGCSVAVFSRAGDAVACALAVERERSTSVTVHAGDLGGLYGASLQELADATLLLSASAASPGVVSSPPVRMLLGSDQTLGFEPVTGGFRIRRSAEDNETTSQSSSVHPQIDGRSAQTWTASRRGRPLAGRAAELARSSAAVANHHAAGHAALILFVGESGMGKTRMLAESAGLASERGERVLVGRCSESGGAFEPFIDALGESVFPFESGQIERDEEGWVDRRRFFGRIAASLSDLGEPITLILDDVQWIDGSSAALIAQLLDDLGPTLTVVAGARPGVEDTLLGGVIQEPSATVVPIGALGRDELADLSRTSGIELSEDSLDSLHSLTGGSPFFVLQLLNHVHNAPGNSLATSELAVGVREWILGRVDRLGASVRDTLTSAAVIGRRFEVVTLADIRGVSPLEALADLDVAAAAGLLLEGSHPGEFRFVHALVSAALENHLSVARRALLHAAIAQCLEESGSTLEHLEQALHHWFEADRLGDPMHAAEIAVEVAARTTERLAHESALTVLERALALLPHVPMSSERDRVEARLRVAHSRASFFASSDDDALDQLYRASDLAETAGDFTTLAEAALLASLNRRGGLDDPDLLELLERASKNCPAEPAVLPAMLHVRRSRLLPTTVRHETRASMARLALADIDSMEPVDRATVEMEVARACWKPDDAAERETLASRHIQLAEEHLSRTGLVRWTGVLVEGYNHRSSARMQLGNIIGALDDANHAARVADEAGTTFLLTRVMMGQAMIHATLGNHDQATQICDDAIALSPRHNLVLARLAVMYSIGRDRNEQTALTDLEQQLEEILDQSPLVVAAFALAHGEAGQIDDARRLLARLRRIGNWPRNWMWLGTTVAALEASILAGEHVMAQRYAAVLERYSGLWALAGAELACWGPVDRALGLAHLAAGRHDEASALLTTALESARAQGAVAWEARCRRDLEAVASLSS